SGPDASVDIRAPSGTSPIISMKLLRFNSVEEMALAQFVELSSLCATGRPLHNPGTVNPNSAFRNLPFGPKPVLRMHAEHLFGFKPRHLLRNKFVPLQVDTRPRLTRQIPKLAKATSESGLIQLIGVFSFLELD